MEQKLHPVLAVRVFNSGKCFGPGIAELLRNVQEHHSLRAAAMSMGMAYSKAWTIIKTCEENLGFRLLSSTAGGKNGGGAVLTAEAEQLLDAFERYREALNRQAEEMFPAYFGDFLSK